MQKLIGRLAAAASAVVLALSCFAVSASAEKAKKTKKSKTDSSAAETVSDTDKDKKKSGDSSEAEEEDTEEHEENFHRSGAWAYTVLPDDTVSISKYYGSSVHPAVPSTIDGFTVSAISGGWFADTDGTILIYGNIHGITYGDNGMISESSVYSPFSENTKLEEVTIPDTVKYIGAIAFKGCKKLKRVNLGKSVKVIGNNCFEDCAALEGITIPENLSYIDLRAFSGCASLKQIALHDMHLEPAVFENCAGLEKITLGKLDEIPQYTFAGCTSLTEFSVPNGTKSIGDSAFEDCTALHSVVIPDSVKEIHNSSFAKCTSLENVQMSTQIEMIGNSAFADCPIKTLVLPDTLKRIGKTAFGMSADGKPLEGFKLECPEYSPAQSYADNNSLKYETISGELPKVTVTEAATTEVNSGSEVTDDVLDSEFLYKLLLVIIGVTAVSIIAAIILIIKNHRLGDDPDEAYSTDDVEKLGENGLPRSGEEQGMGEDFYPADGAYPDAPGYGEQYDGFAPQDEQGGDFYPEDGTYPDAPGYGEQYDDFAPQDEQGGDFYPADGAYPPQENAADDNE